ncbi:unnamed protein product [Parnassius mnemosyne]|uniref:Uncharacterized protein n=1 Tax=Parnassius mnemosyne TaxID=213953 RepID=A0AAV1LU55_9NEOP
MSNLLDVQSEMLRFLAERFPDVNPGELMLTPLSPEPSPAREDSDMEHSGAMTPVEEGSKVTMPARRTGSDARIVARPPAPSPSPTPSQSQSRASSRAPSRAASEGSFDSAASSGEDTEVERRPEGAASSSGDEGFTLVEGRKRRRPAKKADSSRPAKKVASASPSVASPTQGGKPPVNKGVSAKADLTTYLTIYF